MALKRTPNGKFRGDKERKTEPDRAAMDGAVSSQGRLSVRARRIRYNRRSMSRLVLLLTCLAALAAAEKKPVTLDAINSERPAMGPGSPVWSPEGTRFVYTESGKLELYDIAAASSRDLTPMGLMQSAASKVPAEEVFGFENRGVHEQAIQWFPSGRELLISQGGDLFLFRVDAGGWTQLTSTPEAEHDPKLSPDGKRVSFRRGHDLYVMEIASKKVTRLTGDGSATLLNGELDWVYPEELDLGTAHWWAPDSKSIAYLQFDVSREPMYPQTDLVTAKATFEPERYVKAGEPNAEVRVGIVPAAGGATRWMNIGETREMLTARLYWQPDSSAVAVVRLNRVQNRLELLSLSAGTGESRVILSETDPYWINVREDLRWLKGGKEFLWASERNGYQHLYRYSIDGKLLGQVTRGDWEVSDIACVDESAGQLYFISTEASPLERQFYRIGLDGKGKTRLTQAPGTHSVSMGPKCGAYVESFSSLTEPPSRIIRRNDGSQVAVFSPQNRKQVDEYEVLPAKIVEVKAPDGALLYGRLIKPKGFEAGKKYPLLVDVYGGPRAQTVVNRWYGAANMEQLFAQRGYVIWMLDGRGSFGRGHRWETAVFHNFGEKELEDQKTGVQHLISLGFIDPAKVGIQGWSYGGYMTTYAMVHAADVFAAGIAGAPVTNWRNYDSIYTERYMGLPSENASGYEKSSPVNSASGLKGKLLLVHNLEDDNVLFQNTVQMADALERADRQFEAVIYPNKSHGLMRDRKHFAKLTVDFFDRALK